jgi:nitrate/TMAO reductase-like tetraheme cytochrome c subunit
VGGLLMFLAGIVATNGFGAAMSATSSPQFCSTACHYMEEIALPEMKASVHGANAAGVAASCPDCHVPKPLLAKTWRKVQAVREGWGHLTGVISTPEKYEANRARMAEHVWAAMKATDSRECRSCHDFANMKFDDQGRFAARKHKSATTKGETCIDCHKGVAHKLPAGYGDDAEAGESSGGESSGGEAQAAAAPAAAT